MGKASSSSAVTTRRATSSSASPTAAATTTATMPHGDMKRRKKKGRPSLLDLQIRQQQQQRQKANSTTPNSIKTLASPPARRSTRRKPHNSDSYDYEEEEEEEEDDDDDDERQQKKVKLVVRLPQSSQPRDSVSRNSSSAPSSGEDSDGRESEINAGDRRSTDAGTDQGEKVVKVMATVRGSSGSGPTTPLPDKTLLVFVLDRLQKKDTYGVFSEPVDPNELPDYHEIIQHPMDFGTVRKKLNGGVYTKLEQLEADVMLICSNAMQYNSSDTVYYRQARTIQELARRDFDNLRNEGDNGEPQPKVVRRGRPPSNKNAIKKPTTETSPAPDRVGLEASPGTTLASGEDKASGSNGYNLRKAPPMFYKFRSNDGTPFRSRNGENYSDWLVDWNSEFPASILRADMKYGKKHFAEVDEGRRDTYKQFYPSASSSQQPYFSNSFEDTKRLIAVGLHVDPHAYARSLARYAGNLGPAVWTVACKKLKNALPDGLPFGPGWVEENDTPLPFSPEKSNGSVCARDYTPPTANTSSVSDLRSIPRPSGEMGEAICKNEAVGWPTSAAQFQIPHKSTFHPSRNGFNGVFGFDQPCQTGTARLIAQPRAPCHNNSGETKLPENFNFLKHQIPTAVQQPDLNVRAQASGSSPSSSSLQIGSPPPDLALQL